MSFNRMRQAQITNDVRLRSSLATLRPAQLVDIMYGRGPCDHADRSQHRCQRDLNAIAQSRTRTPDLRSLPTSVKRSLQGGCHLASFCSLAATHFNCNAPTAGVARASASRGDIAAAAGPSRLRRACQLARPLGRSTRPSARRAPCRRRRQRHPPRLAFKRWLRAMDGTAWVRSRVGAVALIAPAANRLLMATFACYVVGNTYSNLRPRKRKGPAASAAASTSTAVVEPEPTSGSGRKGKKRRGPKVVRRTRERPER